VDTQTLCVRRIIVCGNFIIRAHVRALTVREDAPSEVTHINA
jgi:hypothetical protein